MNGTCGLPGRELKLSTASISILFPKGCDGRVFFVGSLGGVGKWEIAFSPERQTFNLWGFLVTYMS